MEKKSRESLVNQAKSYTIEENFSKAIELFQELERLDKTDSEIKLFLGIVYLKYGDYLGAIKKINEALIIQPKVPLAYHAIGASLFMLENYSDALLAFDKEIEINPNYPDAHCDKAYALVELNEYKKALIEGEKAIELDPNYPDAHNIVSVAQNHLQNLELAEFYALQAIKLEPLKENYYLNLSNISEKRGEKDKAIKYLNKALSLNPNYREALFNLGLLLLKKMDYKKAWPLFDNRFGIGVKYKKVDNLWDPRSNVSEKVLIKLEQGIGDQILFGSLFHELEFIDNCKFYIELDERLHKTFRRSFSKLNFVKENSLDKDSYTSEYNLGSLGQLFRNNAKDFCRQKIKFLQSDPTRTSTIRSKILEKNNKKKSKICGISWNSKNQKIGKFKNIDLHEFIGILNMPDIIFINLQYESNIDDVVSFSIRNKIEIVSIFDLDLYQDIDSLFSLIDACDFVLTISNVTAHIAGAMGKKTFLLAPFEIGRHWYWHDTIKKSLWYPSVNIYISKKISDWTGAIEEVHQDILSEFNA
jgi:tetratricopeptide (TPR) repeat protein